MVKFLTLDQVIEIHDTFLQLYGGLPGIRDHGLLASAIEMPRITIIGEDVHPTIYDKASAYLYHIIKNHPFNDGNKRSGTGAALMFLRVNGLDPKYDNDSLVEFVVDIARGKYEKADISSFLQKHR